MSVYLDTSFLIPLFTNDLFTARANAFLRDTSPTLIVSDFAAAELASAISRDVRTRILTAEEAQFAFATFDAWKMRAVERIETETVDIAVAETYLRRLDLTLRTPDALHIAIADRLGVLLATFDEKMADSARKLGVPVAAA